jgi:hypothetical protein
MYKINEYYIKINNWIQANPGKTTLIGVFAIGFVLGAIVF